MEWLAQTVISAIISSIIVISFLSVLVNRLQLSLDQKNVGIRRIHIQGQNVKSLIKAMKKSKVIKVLAIAAQGFLICYRPILSNHLANGGDLYFLLATPNSEFVKNASKAEGRGNDAFSAAIHESLALIETIKNDACKIARGKHLNCGDVNIKHYNTELRNQLILCLDHDNNALAWMTISTPNKPAMDSPMIEYSNPDNCIEYYNTIWELH